jgi:DNA sulfur modification protein DndB
LSSEKRRVSDVRSEAVITNQNSQKEKMKVKFPAMEAIIGQRTYYACVMKLSSIPKMFTFTDWIEFTAEDREQRVLNKKRIPDIARYILDNEDGYLFSSITASYKCKVRFEPVNSDGLGFLEMDLEEANFVINDGQHRCAAIAQAIKENPALREESISVLLFPYENKQRVQQMFSDLNRYVVKTAKSLDILFDQRDMLAKVTLEVCESVPAFQGMVDKDNVSLPARSEKMFTLSSLYDATQELLAEKRNSDDAFFNELVTTGVDYWTTVSRFMPDWQRVKNGIRPIELRQENISTHSVVLRALGGLGAEVMKQFPSDWKNRLADLSAVNWSKKNREWENVCMVANSVVSNRQARLATKAYLKRKLALPLTESEEKSIAHLTARANETTSGHRMPEPAPQSNGHLTPQDFLVLLLEVLKSLGGRARKADVDEEAFRKMEATFSQPYWQEIDQGGVRRWQKDLAWAKEKAKHEELVEPPAIAGHGWWQLTRKGRDFDATKQNDRYE